MREAGKERTRAKVEKVKGVRDKRTGRRIGEEIESGGGGERERET